MKISSIALSLIVSVLAPQAFAQVHGCIVTPTNPCPAPGYGGGGGWDGRGGDWDRDGRRDRREGRGPGRYDDPYPYDPYRPRPPYNPPPYNPPPPPYRPPGPPPPPYYPPAPVQTSIRSGVYQAFYGYNRVDLSRLISIYNYQGWRLVDVIIRVRSIGNGYGSAGLMINGYSQGLNTVDFYTRDLSLGRGGYAALGYDVIQLELNGVNVDEITLILSR